VRIRKRDGKKIYRLARDLELEGIVAKPKYGTR